MSENFVGEPMSAGASGRTRSGELEVQFGDGIDLARLRALINTARERAGAPVERVLTLNLIAVHFSDQSWERASMGLDAVSALHPARIVGLIAIPNAERSEISARIAVTRPKGAAFFCERIVLRATGKAVRHLESAIFGLLVPEVPVVAVWGGRAEGALLKHAADGVDRVLFDSGTRPPSALIELSNLAKTGAPVGDLAWARIFPWQSLAADVLDLPNLREHRGNIRAARIISAGEPGAEAMLLAGWFQSRVKKAQVTLEVGPEAPPASEAPTPPPATMQSAGTMPLPPEPVQPGQIIELRFEAPPAMFVLRRERNGILDAQISGDDDGEVVHRLRLPPETPGRLLVHELKVLSGADEIYVAALAEAAAFAKALEKLSP